MKDQVVEAIRDVFEPSMIDESALTEVDGHVYGTVQVIGSPVFDALDDVRRQHRLWDKLIAVLGGDALNVGPVVLQPGRRG